jgi:hypothetical protein
MDKIKLKKKRKVMLVYQAGIANIFLVDCFNLRPYGRNAKRIYQGSFLGAQYITYGMGLMGAVVRTAACNRAGDIGESVWTEDLSSQPFSDKLYVSDYN